MLYRRWLTEGDSVLDAASSPHLGHAIKGGRRQNRISRPAASVPHLSLLVTLEDRRTTGAEKGEMAASSPRPHSSAPSTLAASVIT